MAHKFDAKNKHRLDNEKRRMIMPPYDTLIRLGLKSGDVMADIGCGIGYFTIPASEIVGTGSRIYAMDISMEMLEELERKIQEMHIANIRTIKTDENDFKTEDDLFDFVLISNVFHEVEDKERFINEVKRILKTNGKLAIIDWQKINSESGPPIEHRIEKGQAVKLLNEYGFDTQESLDIGSDFYGIISIKG